MLRPLAAWWIGGALFCACSPQPEAAGPETPDGVETPAADGVPAADEPALPAASAEPAEPPEPDTASPRAESPARPEGAQDERPGADSKGNGKKPPAGRTQAEPSKPPPAPKKPAAATAPPEPPESAATAEPPPEPTRVPTAEQTPPEPPAAPSPTESAAKPRTNVRAYFFGHSLTAFSEPHTNIGEPMCALARHAGLACCGNGRWAAGFHPSTFANYPEPIPAQGQGPSCFREGGDFSGAKINTVVLTETNFYWHNPVETSVQAGAEFIRDIRGSYYPRGPIYLYEHWPEFSRGTTFESWKSKDWKPYHQWYVKLLEGLDRRTDGPRIRLIPVGRVYARLLREIPGLARLGPRALFLDDDPHGTPATYFIAGLVHFMVLYGQKPATDAEAVAALPRYLPAFIEQSYPAIVDVAWDELNQVVDGQGRSRVW